MGGLLAGLASLAPTVVARVLLSLGFSVLTVGGVALSVQALKDIALQQLGTLPIAALQLGSILGLWEGLGIVFGAASWAVSYWTLTKATKIVGGGS